MALLLSAILFAAFMACAAFASSAEAPSPASFGFSRQGLERLDQFYQAKVSNGNMAGIVILIARHGEVVHLKSIGFADLEHSRRMSPDTIFRAYSMTKPIAATALMMLYERGYFQLDDPVSKYIPCFANLVVLRTPTSGLTDTVPLEREPTIRDLLRHTAGLSHGLNTNVIDQEYNRQGLFAMDISLKDVTERLCNIPLLYQPGASWNYSMAPDVEARLVEIFSEKPFEAFLNNQIFKPLRMTDTRFFVPTDKADRLATLYWPKDGTLTPLDDFHGHPLGEFHLVQPWSVNSYTSHHLRTGGSYGLVTTAIDYWHFAQMVLNHGILEGRRLLSPRTVDFMTRDHLSNDAQREAAGRGIGWGLGFAIIKDPVAAGFMSTEGSYFWFGAANTHFWVDPKEDLAVVALAQDMDNPGDASLLTDIRTLVYSALVR